MHASKACGHRHWLLKSSRGALAPCRCASRVSGAHDGRAPLAWADRRGNAARVSWGERGELSCAAVQQGASGEVEEPNVPAPTGATWELDFCSRPILDERGKKLWELLICDSEGKFQHSEFLPNNKINSVVLKKSLQALMEKEGKPKRVLFFRLQLQTIITRSLADLGISAVPSKRCFKLMDWLDERVEGVYKAHPNYDPKAAPGFLPPESVPQDLNDALRGEKWFFVQMDWRSLQGEIDDVVSGKAFGSVFDPGAQSLGFELTDETMVPGVCVFSRRSGPLAGWTSSLEVGCLKPDVGRSCLILETDVNTKWKYAAWDKSPENKAEAQAWQAAKGPVAGLHFLAIQDNPDAETCAGLWLLRERGLPEI